MQATRSKQEAPKVSNSEISPESGKIECGQSNAIAATMAVQKMDGELRCPACQRYFLCPLLLPCGHSLCTSCAAGSLLPSSEPQVAAAVQSTLNFITQDLYSPTIGNPYSSASSSTSGCSVGCLTQTTQTGTNPQMYGTGHNNFTVPSGCSNSDSDQVSVLSETDSGVVVSSRPPSYLGRLPLLISLQSSHQINPTLITHGLLCPACNRIIGLFDEKGISHLQRNKALERIIHKFVDPKQLQQSLLNSSKNEVESPQLLPITDPLNRPGGPLCQLCEDPEDPGNVAAHWCQQCEIFYCIQCREKCHPSRGPLLRHVLHPASKGAEIVRQKRQSQPATCPVHPQMSMGSYCLNCSVSVCNECLQVDGNGVADIHSKHDVQPLNTACKSKKTELSQALQSLSEKARSGTEFIQHLRSKAEDVNQKFTESEHYVSSQLDCLLKEIEKKKAELTTQLRQTREKQLHELKNQMGHVTSTLTHSTGLIQFCIEMLKESDSTAFLLVSTSLISRALETEQQFVQELDRVAAVRATTETLLQCLTVCSSGNVKSPQSLCEVLPGTAKNTAKCGLQSTSIDAIKKAIAELALHENLGKNVCECGSARSMNSKTEVPAAPAFISDECISERNVFTLVWRPCPAARVDRYTLEMDDGANGAFRKVYRGPQTICTVEGLHFRSVYRARVKAHNETGESEYSQTLYLQTSDLTWFHLDGLHVQPEVLLTNGNRTVTSQSSEDRVVLGSTGLSRGIHYWEFTVDRCELGGQPAFGIARQDCNKHIMLGLDMRSWSAYFDHKRSWFLHNGEHFERTDGGVRAGSVVGVRFDCDRGSLSFYLNDEPHGPIAFTNLPSGVYYPAVSLTRSIQLTLHSGLEAPSESEESDEDSSGGGTGTETTSMATTILGQPTTLALFVPQPTSTKH